MLFFEELLKGNLLKYDKLELRRYKLLELGIELVALSHALYKTDAF